MQKMITFKTFAVINERLNCTLICLACSILSMVTVRGYATTALYHASVLNNQERVIISSYSHIAFRHLRVAELEMNFNL